MIHSSQVVGENFLFTPSVMSMALKGIVWKTMYSWEVLYRTVCDVYIFFLNVIVFYKSGLPNGRDVFDQNILWSYAFTHIERKRKYTQSV